MEREARQIWPGTDIDAPSGPGADISQSHFQFSRPSLWTLELTRRQYLVICQERIEADGSEEERGKPANAEGEERDELVLGLQTSVEGRQGSTACCL